MNEKPIRVAVVGVGEFGRNHVRVFAEMQGVELIGVVDTNASRAAQVAAEFTTRVLRDLDSLKVEKIDAVSIAVPTKEHAPLGCRLLDWGLDVLVEKPMAASVGEANGLIASAQRANRILQVGHLERFNPAVTAVKKIVANPMFFEVHRLGIFTPRSLDIDVVYDIMIHDLDILLSLMDSPVTDLKAVGIPVITDKVDIAHARLEFATGAVANLTASRVSTERVRKMRFFQAHEYVSIDFTRQDLLRVRVDQASGQPNGQPPPLPQINFEKVPTVPEEPLRAELRAFVHAVRTRRPPRVDGAAGRAALELADRVMAGIQEHARRVKLDARSPQETK
ncbi:MAG: Gfo/Idh/MocA family oxidoreductase [Candidatus Acidiferrales bacterium]